MSDPIYSSLDGKFNSANCPDGGGGASNCCPDGYYRNTTCAFPSDPGYNTTMMSCGYPFQVNCFTYVGGDGANCVSFCDNV